MTVYTVKTSLKLQRPVGLARLMAANWVGSVRGLKDNIQSVFIFALFSTVICIIL